MDLVAAIGNRALFGSRALGAGRELYRGRPGEAHEECNGRIAIGPKQLQALRHATPNLLLCEKCYTQLAAV